MFLLLLLYEYVHKKIAFIYKLMHNKWLPTRPNARRSKVYFCVCVFFIRRVKKNHFCFFEHAPQSLTT